MQELRELLLNDGLDSSEVNKLTTQLDNTGSALTGFMLDMDTIEQINYNTAYHAQYNPDLEVVRIGVNFVDGFEDWKDLQDLLLGLAN